MIRGKNKMNKLKITAQQQSGLSEWGIIDAC